MKKYFVFGLILSLLFPYFTFAYDLSMKDSSIVESATAKIEKIIATRGESIRNQVIALLKKATVTYNSNARMKTIIEKTIENIQIKDLSLGNLFGEENTTIVQPQPPYQKHEETRENRNIVTVPTIKSENKTPVCTTVYDTVTGASGTQTQVPRQSCAPATTITSTPKPGNNLFGDVKTSTNIAPVPVVVNTPIIKSCYIQNGEGQEVGGVCIVKNCSSGYTSYGTTCKDIQSILNSSTQNILKNQILSRRCYVENGDGQETFSDNAWGSCNVVSCINRYHKESNSCVSNTQSCTIVNGIGQRIWNDGGFSMCNLVSCNLGYENINGICNPILVCDGDRTHQEGTVCVSSTRSCTVPNGVGQATYMIGGWRECGGDISCNDGYERNWGYVGDICISKKYPGCDTSDSILSNGSRWAACNIGANSPSEPGDYYQWGRNDTGFTMGWKEYKWITYSSSASLGMQGGFPCAENYHIPSYSEWKADYDNQGDSLIGILKLSLGGYLDTNGLSLGNGEMGFYWSTTPSAMFPTESLSAYSVRIDSTRVHSIGLASKGIAGTIRCKRN